MAHCFFKGHNVQRIDSSRDIVLANNHDNISPNRYEVRVRDDEMPPVSEMQREWPEAILHALPDFLRIH